MFEIISPPTFEPYTLAELKELLRVNHDSDDEMITGMATTARTFIERRADIALAHQTWRLRLSGLPACPVPLRPGRVSRILGGTVGPVAGLSVALNETNWTWTRGRPDTISLQIDQTFSGPIAISLDFTSGVAAPRDISPDLRRAVALLTAHYYEERELFRAQRFVPTPHNVEVLLEAHREIRV